MKDSESNSFIRVKAPITSDNFEGELKHCMGENTHAAYRVLAFVKNSPRSICRIAGTDTDGILAIGQGRHDRMLELATSIKTDHEIHHVGLKISQVIDSLTTHNELDLYLDIYPCQSKERAVEVEKSEQRSYRMKYGENPPYSGRWEG